MLERQSRYFPAIFATLLFFSSSLFDWAQEPEVLQAEDFNFIHWAYAPAFGTGVYYIGEGQEIYVLRVTPKFTHRFKFEKMFKDRDLILEFKLPLSFGIHDFNYLDLAGFDFPEQIKQISLTPGIELELPVSSRWNVRIFGNFGWGSATESGGESAWIYWAGIKSRLLFPIKNIDLALLNGYGGYGYTPNHGDHSDISSLMNGFELDIPIGKIGASQEPFIIKTHVINFWYFDHVDFLVDPRKSPVSLGSEWEIGVAVGKVRRIKLWLFRIDRIGLGYRFSKYSRGIRIYFSSYFR